MRTGLSAAALLLVAARSGAEPLRDFCPDRPGLGTPACTIDKGHVAVELGLVDWTRDRGAGDFAAGELLVRYGLGDRLEMQLGWTALGEDGGTGDVVVALRRNLGHPDGAGLAVALMPFATLPAGSGGAGDWGAGLLVPVSYRLRSGLALDLTAGAEAAVDADGDGRHLAYGAVLGLDVPLTGRMGATVELSARRDRDPAGATTEWLAGLSADWMAGDDLQLDIGANAGLDRDAPDLELYVGLARRF